MAADETNGWQPIETAPVGKQMFVVQAFEAVLAQAGVTYTSDPCCTWRHTDGTFPRWPHEFPPTHWTPLPKPPT